MNRKTARVLWWVGAVALTVGIYIGLDRIAWVDQLPELVQSVLRIACGALMIALAGILDPWRRREEQSEP